MTDNSTTTSTEQRWQTAANHCLEKTASFSDRVGQFMHENAPLVGGVAGAAAGALLPSAFGKDYEVTYDAYGNPVKKPKTNWLGKATNVALGALGGAGLGYGYQSLNGNSFSEKMGIDKPWEVGHLSYIPKTRGGKVIDEADRFTGDVGGAKVIGGGRMTHDKLRDYMDPTHYTQQLLTSAQSAGGQKRLTPIITKLKEDLMAGGVDPENPQIQPQLQQAALQKYNEYFSKAYTNYLEQQYGYNPGELSTYVPPIFG